MPSYAPSAGPTTKAAISNASHAGGAVGSASVTAGMRVRAADSARAAANPTAVITSCALTVGGRGDFSVRRGDKCCTMGRDHVWPTRRK